MKRTWRKIKLAEQRYKHQSAINEDATRRFDASKDGPEPSQFGYAQPGPHTLESHDPDCKYTLLLSSSEKTVEGGVEHHRRAELIQTAPQGTVSQRLVLYENEFLETID